MPIIEAGIVANGKPSLARRTVEAYFCNLIHQKIVAKKISGFSVRMRMATAQIIMKVYYSNWFEFS